MWINKPILGTVAVPNGRGYYLVASDGGVFSYGNVSFFGSLGGQHLPSAVVSMTFEG